MLKHNPEPWKGYMQLMQRKQEFRLCIHSRDDVGDTYGVIIIARNILVLSMQIQDHVMSLHGFKDRKSLFVPFHSNLRVSGEARGVHLDACDASAGGVGNCGGRDGGVEVECLEEGHVGSDRLKTFAVRDCSGDCGYWRHEIGLEIVSCALLMRTYVSA